MLTTMKGAVKQAIVASFSFFSAFGSKQQITMIVKNGSAP
jgi:hypothetical protein